MNLTKKEYKQGYDKSAFYAEMGIFFADKYYRREMPYLINSEQKEWSLFYENDVLAAFYAHEDKSDHTAVSGLYILADFRSSGIAGQILEDILACFDSVRLVTCNQRLLTMLTKRRFVCISRRGSYYTMEWRKKNDFAENS